jgi:Rrf2 family protein
MRLTKSTSHAIRILLECASADDRLVKVAVLSERLDITQQNIFKIVNLLAKAGLLEAVRGRNGGVKLAHPASEIRIGDVVRASEVTRVEIEDEDRRTHGRGHGVNQILDDALGAFIDVLDQHTLADMAKGQRLPGASRRGKVRGRAKSVAGTPSRVRRALHESN